MSTGRNEPCPCGSGRKYKVCHGSPQAPAPTGSGDTATAILQQALQSLDRNDYARTQMLCQRILESNPNQAEARHYLGMALCFVGRMDEGIVHLRTSLTLRPSPPVEHNLAVFHNNLGLWLEKTEDLDGAEENYKQALNSKIDYQQARFNLMKLLMRRQRIFPARILLEELLRLDPQNPELRGRMAEVYFQMKEYTTMEQEYRALIAHSPRPAPLHLNLGNNLRQAGRAEDARIEFEAALALEPGNLEAITHIAQIEEARHNLEESERRTLTGLALQPQGPMLHLHMARLRRRQNKLTEALDWLDRITVANLPDGEGKSKVHRERGMVLDKLKRTDEAFAAFQSANDIDRADIETLTGAPFYDKNRTQAIFSANKHFFTRERVTAMASYSPPAPVPAPVFIVGFPRSGTTLVEQMVTTHQHIHAGDELQGIPFTMAYGASHYLGTLKNYPDCLAEVIDAGKHDALLALRDYYMHLAREARALPTDKPRFTDKMPLNEEALGLIRLILPESPIIHVIRHPLDVMLSCYSNLLNHGGYCSRTLDTLAFHYKGVWDLVDHYVAEIPDLRYTRVRYEDLLADPEREMRRLFEFLGEAWEPRCLEFHKAERVARTASYAQVNQPLYRSSQERWRPYRQHLEPIIPELKPLIEKLGYSVD